MNIPFSLTIGEDGEGSLSLFIHGEQKIIRHDHPHFGRIIHAVTNGEDPTEWLTNLAEKVVQIDHRVSVKNDTVYFDGEAVHNTLTRTIVRYLNEGRDTTRLVKFMENLDENPSMRSREALFQWVQELDLVIDEDGYFIGYKGVTADGLSCTAGPGIVNGVATNGHLDNSVGNIIEMERTKVMDDPNVGCSHGLHVGTYAYAHGFGARLLEVRVNPRDVVSVPNDSGFQKLRCCRYEVLKVHDLPEDDLSDWEEEVEVDETGEEEYLVAVVPASWLERMRRNVKSRFVD